MSAVEQPWKKEVKRLKRLLRTSERERLVLLKELKRIRGLGLEGDLRAVKDVETNMSTSDADLLSLSSDSQHQDSSKLKEALVQSQMKIEAVQAQRLNDLAEMRNANESAMQEMSRNLEQLKETANKVRIKYSTMTYSCDRSSPY